MNISHTFTHMSTFKDWADMHIERLIHMNMLHTPTYMNTEPAHASWDWWRCIYYNWRSHRKCITRDWQRSYLIVKEYIGYSWKKTVNTSNSTNLEFKLTSTRSTTGKPMAPIEFLHHDICYTPTKCRHTCQLHAIFHVSYTCAITIY